MIDTSVIYIKQGEYRISVEPEVQISTILGSCVAACIWDPRAAIGGMNHFLLPFGSGGTVGGSLRYGVHSMETLINGLLGQGASRKHLQAKLFGGATMSANLGNIGSENARFAREFLENEDIRCVASDLEGAFARRVVFRPTTGQARVMTVRQSDIGRTTDVAPPVVDRRKDDWVLF